MSDFYELYEKFSRAAVPSAPARIEDCKDFGQLKAFAQAENVVFMRLDLAAKLRLRLITPAEYATQVGKLEARA